MPQQRHPESLVRRATTITAMAPESHRGAREGARPSPSPAMTERALQAAIVQAAGLLGWNLIFHAWLSVHSTAGFPDLVMLRPPRDGEPGRILVVEVKRERGVVTEAQRRWLDGFQACGMAAVVWRPRDWLSGEVERVLRGGDP